MGILDPAKDIAVSSLNGNTNIQVKTAEAKAPRKKTGRELVYEDFKEYIARPNNKLLKDIKDKCFDLNINFE
jgi:hypothetical protein